MKYCNIYKLVAKNWKNEEKTENYENSLSEEIFRKEIAKFIIKTNLTKRVEITYIILIIFKIWGPVLKNYT